MSEELDMPLLKPDVYQRVGSDQVPKFPSLIGGKCVCGHVFFPWQSYGCEMCGGHGSVLTRCALSGTGRLVGVAPVHLHAGKRSAPFTVVSVELDDGPVVRTLLDGETAKIGDRVTSVLVSVSNPDTDETALDLRFQVVASEAVA